MSEETSMLGNIVADEFTRDGIVARYDSLVSAEPFITVWERQNKDGVWEHNHYEVGWGKGEAPTPKSDLQKRSWVKAKWRKREAMLFNGRIWNFDPTGSYSPDEFEGLEHLIKEGFKDE